MFPLDSTETTHGQHAVRHNKSRWRQHVLLSGRIYISRQHKTARRASKKNDRQMSPLDSTETAHGQHAVRHNKSRWRQHVLLSGLIENRSPGIRIKERK
ncbi:hypothetical protein TSAR_014382 [Trichomalopsis sarcophagae]|uniref:Uncharacterized protein n=1 Tax=Trichomalopsis sarcophagae TaxID=543379 RepID=A0A232EJH9_9HYME|nr:hypothetical protein TSAR_014382 [Trichomalopsis sarcophagae]